MMDFKTYFELLNLYSDYAMVCDSAEWEKWPDFFVEEGTYRLQPRENFDQGLPLCLLALESKNMIRDRVYGVKETMYHDPYYQRHIVGTPRVVSVERGIYDGRDWQGVGYRWICSCGSHQGWSKTWGKAHFWGKRHERGTTPGHTGPAPAPKHLRWCF